ARRPGRRGAAREGARGRADVPGARGSDGAVRVVRTIAGVRESLSGDVGLVPTMGALHDGHLSLLRAARAENDTVVMSLFVNPAQFDEGADLAAYPRDEERDARIAEDAGVDVLFAPSGDEIYPPGFATWVDVEV